MSQAIEIVPFHQMVCGQELISFVLLAEKEEGRTKDGKPYYRVLFCDTCRKITYMVWLDSPFFQDCKEKWQIGQFYKIRGIYRETSSYGPRLDLKRIRVVTAADQQDGFDPNQCRLCSRIPPDTLREEILNLAKAQLAKGPLLFLIQKIFNDYHDALLEAAASGYHHHIYPGGLLEHTLSVTKITIQLVDHFRSFYPQKKALLSKPLAVTGAILHDLGKMEGMESNGVQYRHSLSGEMIGHFILGRDLVHHYGPLVGLDSTTQLLLEHIILAHSKSPDWNAPCMPMSLEAIIIQEADCVEANYSCALHILETDESPRNITCKKGPCGAFLWKPSEDNTNK